MDTFVSDHTGEIYPAATVKGCHRSKKFVVDREGYAIIRKNVVDQGELVVHKLECVNLLVLGI